MPALSTSASKTLLTDKTGLRHMSCSDPVARDREQTSGAQTSYPPNSDFLFSGGWSASSLGGLNTSLVSFGQR